MQDRAQSQTQVQSQRARPRISVFDKWKIWIWNSSATFEYLPNEALNTTLLLAFLGAVLVTAATFIASYLTFGFLGLFIPKVSASSVGLYCATALGLAAAAVTVPAILISAFVGKLAIKATAGLTGALVGLATSFLMICKNPHRYWVRKFNQKRNQVIQQQIAQQHAQCAVADLESRQQGLQGIIDNGQADLEVYSDLVQTTERLQQTQAAHRGLSFITSNPIYRLLSWSYGATQQMENLAVNNGSISPRFIKFASFNPNVTRCALTNVDLGTIPQDSKSAESKASHPPVKEVVVASDGRFYSLDALKDPANAAKIPAELKWTDADKVPEQLRLKFMENETTCSIEYDVVKQQRDAVRSVYGHYYNKKNLQTWVELKSTCPMRSGFLSMAFTSPINKELEIGPRSAKVAPAPTLASAIANYDDTQSESQISERRSFGR